MRRAFPALMLVLLSALPAAAAVAPEPGDSIHSEWQRAGSRMSALGLLQGRPGEGLALTTTLTRAELATLLVRAIGLEREVQQLLAADQSAFESAAVRRPPAAYVDTIGHWSDVYLRVARPHLGKTGVSLGYADGTFRPDHAVTEAEMGAFIAKFFGLVPDLERSWPDNYLKDAVRIGLIERQGASLCYNRSVWDFSPRGCAVYQVDQILRTTYVDGRSLYETYHRHIPAVESYKMSIPSPKLKNR